MPRVLFVVEDQPPSPLASRREREWVRSARSVYEKPPWKDLEPLYGVVESDFVRPLLLGEHVPPYRALPPRQCVVPWEPNQLMSGCGSSERPTLLEQLDYRRKLTNQFPVLPQRVVYAKAGMHLAAARVTDATPAIDHTLYWGPAADGAEARYLCAVLNSPLVTEMVRPLQSYGKYVWQLPIRRFNPNDANHREAEEEIAALLGSAAPYPRAPR